MSKNSQEIDTLETAAHLVMLWGLIATVVFTAVLAAAGVIVWGADSLAVTKTVPAEDCK